MMNVSNVNKTLTLTREYRSAKIKSLFDIIEKMLYNIKCRKRVLAWKKAEL